MSVLIGMLFPLPQLSLPLRYSKDRKPTIAKADFIILDLLSFYRMAVFEDKNAAADSDSEQSTSQLIAEAIAAQQYNLVQFDKGAFSPGAIMGVDDGKSCGVDSIFGVKVIGCKFFFYVIPISAAILKAMETMSRAEEITTVFQLESGFDFRFPPDREIIIYILDQMRQNIERKGIQSPRRNFEIRRKAK